MLVRQVKEESVIGFNFREMAPSASTPDMFAANPDAARKVCDHCSKFLAHLLK